jgi:hypothetical protein
MAKKSKNYAKATAFKSGMMELCMRGSGPIIRLMGEAPSGMLKETYT